MDLTRFAIEKSRITAVALVCLVLAGAHAYTALPRNEDPGFIVRTALVQTFFPGAGPERVEQLVTDKLEKVIQEIPELDFVRSTSKVGVSVIYVNVREEYDRMRPIWDNLRRKVADAGPELPDGILGPYVNDEFGDVFGTIIAITGEDFDYRELKDIADEVRDELLLIPDVAKVEIHGAQEERVFVEYDNARLAQYGLSPRQMQQLLEQRNIILPGGDITTEYEKVVLEPSGSFESVEELRRSVINIPGSREVVRVEDLVDIRRGYVEPPETIMRATGVRSLGLAISLRQGGNIIDMGQAVREVIRRAHTVYPIGIEFDFILDQSGVVDKKIRDFRASLLQAVAVVTLVMLVFLGLRTGLIVASLIPTAILSSFLVMSVLGIGLDQMSLASLIIALGMLVDNAIVMSESIAVRMAGGQAGKQAAVDSARELRNPLLTSSLTTAAAFLPIFLAESATGEYTAPLFKVVTITLLCSWLLALTLIPTLCANLLRVRHEPATFDSPFYRRYRQALLAAVRHPLLTLAGVGVAFFLALQGLGLVPTIFFPENDRPTFSIELELPVGTPIERTRKVTRAIEESMQQNLVASDERAAGLTRWATFIGEGAPRYVLPYTPEPLAPGYAYVLANATSREVITGQLIPSLQRYITDQFPEVNPTIRPLPLGAPAWPPVAIRISGRDTDTLFGIVDDLKAELETVPGARQISDDWGARSKKIMVDIDGTRARLAGVSHEDIAISLQTHLTGLQTTEFREEDKLIPIVLRARGSRQIDIDRVASANVYSQATGESVPLQQVAAARLVWQPSSIERRNRLRTVTVEALLEPGFTAAQVNRVLEPWLEEKARNWPFGYGWEFGGEAETSDKANASIMAKLPVAGLIIVLLLVGQFNSVRRPLIILLTIPLALIGVTIGLLVLDSYFGFMTLLGIISLAGIVINNAIVLLDRIRIERQDNGLDPAHAVIESAQKRLRPILLTAGTTVMGLLPLYLGGGPMWEPMAIAIIFGLAFATVLTLGVVPVLYTLLFRVDFSSLRY